MKNIYLLTLAFLMNALWLKAQTPCPNLVTNGDFEVPNASFAYGLSFNAACSFNSYAITTRFNLKCANLPPVFGDHTSGAGKFLVIESSNTVGNMWSTNVTVTPNTPYTFSFWASGALGNFAEPLSANLAMAINNGPNLPVTISIGNNTGWNQYTYSGTTPAGVTNLAIAIKQITGGLGGSTYGIDDIVFTACSDAPCSTCPTGVTSANLITNGSFSTTTGSLGFTSALNSGVPSANCGTNRFGITTDFPTFCNGWGPLSPHSGPTFLALDGDANPAVSTVLWQTPVTLTANTNYNFSFWWALAFAHPSQNFPVSINILDGTGAVVGTIGTQVIANNLTWTNTCLSWNSGALVGSYSLAISQQTGSIYRDWAIDDIYFTKSPIQPCKAEFTFQKIDSCGKVQFTNTSVPTTGVTYCWDFDNNLATCESTAQNPLFQFPTCGTYNVGLIITGTDCKDTIKHIVTISDNIAPIARCKPSTSVILNANCQYNVTTAFVDNGSTDNCQIKTLAVNPAMITGCKNTTVTLTVTDWCNNVSTCTMGIQTIDTFPPVIVCPPNISVTCTRDTTPSVTGVATATDNCFGTITFTHSDVITGILPCNATIRRTWTARDTCGNVSSCVQTITVNDNVPPTIVCPQSYSVNTNLGFCYYTGTLTQPTALDNCGQTPTLICSLITPTSSILITPQTQFPKGINSISCIARDACGNTSTPCTFTLTVIDNEKPKIICPLSISVAGTITPPSMVCKAIVNGLAPTATDNCPMSSVNFTITGATVLIGTSGDASGTVFIQGVSTVTYFVTDMAGNKDSCKFTVTVLCEGCRCGNFVDLFYRPSQGGATAPKVCGDTLPVFCNPQFTPVLTGAFNCIGVCSPTGISYEIRKLPNGPIVQTGVLTYPNFTLPLLASYFTSAGFYELTLTGQCGTAVSCVPCKFTLNVQSCDTCQCRGFEAMSFYNSAWPQPLTKPAKCDSTYNLPCTPIGSLFYFHGNFLCSSRACMPDSVSYSIGESGIKVISGNVVLNPMNGPMGHFDVILDPALFTAGATYTMTVTGKCGNQVCSCKITFTFAPCGCLCETLVSDVKKGFKTLGTTIIGCKKTIMPMGLCPNDVVTWTVANNSVITTTGNASLSLTFTSSGVYLVCMTVTRFNPNGTLCGKSTYCQNITVICPTPFPLPNVTHCRKNGINGNAVKNGDFTEGAIEGHLGFGGAVQNWTLFPNVGDGFIMVDKNTGASDSGHLMLNANSSNRAGVFQQITLPISTFTVVEYYARNYSGTTLPAGTVLEFRLYNEPIVGSPSQLIYSDTIPKDSLAWMRRTFSPRVSPDQTKRFFNICLSNNTTTDKSTIGIDNIEMCSSTTVDTKEATVLRQFQIVPNPNQGTFTVVLSEGATLGTKLRILNSMGQFVRDFSTKLNNEEQTIQANDLPNGMYFLQVVLDGKVVGVEKFVKQ